MSAREARRHGLSLALAALASGAVAACGFPPAGAQPEASVSRAWRIAGEQDLEIGFVTGQVPDPSGLPVRIAVWYPSAPAPSRRPLAIISHRSGGDELDHADTAKALAGAGFVAVALHHADPVPENAPGTPDLAVRLRQLDLVVAHMLVSPPAGVQIDPRRIGAYGFALGGATVLAWAAGNFDSSRSAARCGTSRRLAKCMGVAARMADPPASPADRPPIRALVVAAPAPEIVLAREGLRRVNIPVQLWHAGGDDALPGPPPAETVRNALPVPPDYRVIEGATQLAFLTACRERAGAAEAQCRDSSGFDNAAFRDHFNREVVRFFRARLG